MKRFAFGNNWNDFSQFINDNRIALAERSLKEMLGIETLEGKTFLDIGCGSGLFSLAAVRLGAKRVHSFDYDPQSVATTTAVKKTYLPDGDNWTIERGDALDSAYLDSLGKFDVTYSWGVLHHTGKMWRALENVTRTVAVPGGSLFIALYNDQGWKSTCWKIIKVLYNALPGFLKYLILLPVFASLWGPTFVRDGLRLNPFATWKTYCRNRAMSPWHDVVDWIGGFPFEVAAPDAVTAFYRTKGFTLRKLNTCGKGFGNNEFVFERA
jgi:2-polyprenyl-6-hydroxyphenyl methylase/3-demethylubiquinone-9 3-methyltransferase